MLNKETNKYSKIEKTEKSNRHHRLIMLEELRWCGFDIYLHKYTYIYSPQTHPTDDNLIGIWESWVWDNTLG